MQRGCHAKRLSTWHSCLRAIWHRLFPINKTHENWHGWKLGVSDEVHTWNFFVIWFRSNILEAFTFTWQHKTSINWCNWHKLEKKWHCQHTRLIVKITVKTELKTPFMIEAVLRYKQIMNSVIKRCHSSIVLMDTENDPDSRTLIQT